MSPVTTWSSGEYHLLHLWLLHVEVPRTRYNEFGIRFFALLFCNTLCLWARLQKQTVIYCVTSTYDFITRYMRFSRLRFWERVFCLVTSFRFVGCLKLLGGSNSFNLYLRTVTYFPKRGTEFRSETSVYTKLQPGTSHKAAGIISTGMRRITTFRLTADRIHDGGPIKLW
jgi:hypothetical protein